MTQEPHACWTKESLEAEIRLMVFTMRPALPGEPLVLFVSELAAREIRRLSPVLPPYVVIQEVAAA